MVFKPQGFTEPAFQALAVKVEDANKNGRKVICSLMLDEMAIRKHVSWDGEKFRGCLLYTSPSPRDS